MNVEQDEVDIQYSPAFLRMYKKLSESLKDDVDEKVELFRIRSNHQRLKVHKFKGGRKVFYSFSVNYSYRIIFEWVNGIAVILLEVGDHDIYD